MLQDRKVALSCGVSNITDFSRYLSDIYTDEAFNESYNSTAELVCHPSSRYDKKHNYNEVYL